LRGDASTAEPAERTNMRSAGEERPAAPESRSWPARACPPTGTIWTP